MHTTHYLMTIVINNSTNLYIRYIFISFISSVIIHIPQSHLTDRDSHTAKETKKNSYGTIQCKRDQLSRLMLQSYKITNYNRQFVIITYFFGGYRSNSLIIFPSSLRLLSIRVQKETVWFAGAWGLGSKMFN